MFSSARNMLTTAWQTSAAMVAHGLTAPARDMLTRPTQNRPPSDAVRLCRRRPPRSPRHDVLRVDTKAIYSPLSTLRVQHERCVATLRALLLTLFLIRRQVIIYDVDSHEIGRALDDVRKRRGLPIEHRGQYLCRHEEERGRTSKTCAGGLPRRYEYWSEETILVHY